MRSPGFSRTAASAVCSCPSPSGTTFSHQRCLSVSRGSRVPLFLPSGRRATLCAATVSVVSPVLGGEPPAGPGADLTSESPAQPPAWRGPALGGDGTNVPPAAAGSPNPGRLEPGPRGGERPRGRRDEDTASARSAPSACSSSEASLPEPRQDADATRAGPTCEALRAEGLALRTTGLPQTRGSPHTSQGRGDRLCPHPFRTGVRTQGPPGPAADGSGRPLTSTT